MKSAGNNNAPVFALDEDTMWADLEDAMAGAAQYQANTLGVIRPLMFFAPLTKPWNPDAWVPMKTTPLNLLIVSMERTADGVLREALRQAEAALGGTDLADGFAWLPPIDFEEDAVAAVYARLEAGTSTRARTRRRFTSCAVPSQCALLTRRCGR